jgi:hypothetical protein
MRGICLFHCVALLTCFALSQQSSSPARGGENQAVQSGASDLKAAFEAKIKTEWDALKNRDKKTYGDLLADEYQGVETDGKGERNKIQSINEVAELNVSNYSMWGLKVTALSPDAAFVVYEITMQFPPKSVMRYSRIYIGSVWVKQDGEWKELHYQETHVK